MSKWEMVKLKDAFNLQMGKTPSRDDATYWNGENNWVAISDLSICGKYIDKTKERISDKAIYESGIKPVPENTVIMSFKLSIGKVAITTKSIFTNEAIMSFIDNRSFAVDNNYIYHLFKGKDWNEGTNKAVMGITLNKATLSEIEIPLPPLTIQQKIATNLDKVTELINLRKKQIEKLDELVKCRFVEMFGDCNLSHHKENWVPIASIGTVVGGSTPKTAKSEYWDGEYRWITPAELKADTGYIFDSERKITKAGIESCSLRELPINTVILTSRAPIGKLAIAGNAFYCNQGFKNIICNDNVIPRYLYSLFLFNVDYLISLGRGATFKEISKSIVESIQVPLPPLSLQSQFADFVQQVDKSKSVLQQSLDEAEILYKSLMQKYFD